MPSLERYLPVKCSNCDGMVVKKHMARHQKFFDSVVLSCTKCPHLYTKQRGDWNNYHLTDHHVPKYKLSSICMVCLEEFPYFCFLQQHKKRKMEFRQKLGPNRVIRPKKF